MLSNRFIKYFFIISCLLSISFPLINIYFVFPSFSALLARNTEEESVRMANHFSSMIMGRNGELMEADGIAGTISKFKKDFYLEKIRVFSVTGEIIYSTDPKEIGTINDKSYFHEIVAAGHPYSKTVKKETASLEGRLLKVDVVETYVPIMRDGRFLGAFEVYYDITGRNAMLHKTVFHSALISFAVMFALFLTMVVFLLKADRQGPGIQQDSPFFNHDSPAYLLFVTMISLFIAETIIMFIISFFPPVSRLSESLIDSALLIMMVSPSLYFFLFRPLSIKIDGLKQAHEELQKSHIKITESNNKLYAEIEERKNTEKLLVKSQQEWEDTFNVITDMITVHDRDFNIIRANRAAEKILDLPFIKDTNLKCFKFYHGTDTPPQGCPSCNCLTSGKPAVFEVFEPHLQRHIEIRALPRFDTNNQIEGLIHVVRDITERKDMEDKLKSMSLTDELTGLYNRRGFFSLLEQQIKEIRRQKVKAYLLYADIDNFKVINDSFGHCTGDLILIETANILRTTYRESDLIARLGGDEFVVFPVGHEESQIGPIIGRLQKNIDAFNELEERGYKLSISMGVAPYDPTESTAIDDLLAEADRRMYEIKRQKQEV
ncbi:MAG: GGDEF domain-containing protein [Nitrospiraceae bacterium]|nr:MAG: GGDEF domain-containing protein [Nitrospiraceae bacterium]